MRQREREAAWRRSDKDTRAFQVALEGWRKMKPTREHHIIFYPGLFGTLHAVSPSRKVRYCDFNRREALKWAEINPKLWYDFRLARAPFSCDITGTGEGPRRGDWCWWALTMPLARV